MNDVAEFYRWHNAVQAGEARLKEVTKTLKEAYDKLVHVCPHPEAITWNTDIRGWGNWVVCKVCGVEDHALIGSTPGDEYDYGYPGTYDKDFWKDTVIENVSEKESWDYRRRHYYQVVKGKVVDRL